MKESQTYWAGNGKYQKEYDKLFEAFVPRSGKADTIYGEILRGITNLNHEAFNNGNGNAYDEHSYKDIREDYMEYLELIEEYVPDTEGWIPDIKDAIRLQYAPFKPYDRVMDMCIEWVIKETEGHVRLLSEEEQFLIIANFMFRNHEDRFVKVFPHAYSVALFGWNEYTSVNFNNKNTRLKFMTDWSWLMKLVEQVFITVDFWMPIFDEQEKLAGEIQKSLRAVDSKVTYYKCLEFISEYNKHID